MDRQPPHVPLLAKSANCNERLDSGVPEQPDKPDKKITATFIVITKPYPPAGDTKHKGWNAHQKLAVASKEAIKETGQTGELTGWVLTKGNTTLSFESTFEDAGIKDGDKLHLNPKKGTGGTRA